MSEKELGMLHNNLLFNPKSKKMKLQFNKSTRIRDAKKKFAELYPFLKLELYNMPHNEMKLSNKNERLPPDTFISEVGNRVSRGTLDVSKNRTVAEVENEFFQKFGIALQVSRKSGTFWIETSATDNRTLEMQNKMGEENTISATKLRRIF